MTTTKYESAKLILELYNLRREAKMREARDWVWTFKPKSADDVNAIYKSADSAKFRMVVSYWDMAATLAVHEAIDIAMFEETNGECLFIFAKLEPFLADLRKANPMFVLNLEKAIHKMPHGKMMLEHVRKMV